MALTKNMNYHFTNVEYSAMALAYYAAPAANLRNVCLMKADYDDRRQVWKYQNDTGVGDRLHVCTDSTYVLDRSSGATNSYENNAHLYNASSTSATDSALIIENVSGNIYRIKLADGRCLTAANNNSGATASTITSSAQLTSGIKNVYWATAFSEASSNYDKQCWKAMLVDAPINSEVTVTYMPENADYPNRTEYFHPESGMKDSSWSANGGSSIASKVKSFYEKVYGESPSGNGKYLYNLYGAKLRGTSKYHIGVDMTKGSGSIVKSPISGTVVKNGSDNNHSIGIYDGARTYYFLHMNPVYVNSSTAQINVGDELGKESDYGNATGSHLHVEVYEGRVTNGPQNTVAVTASIPSICPYDTF